LPTNYLTIANYPNPFNNSTIFKFNLDKPSAFKLSIFDVTGRMVKSFSGSAIAGKNDVNWKVGREDGLSSGVYFYRLVAGDQTGQGKITFLK
jgi:hypothetical protein